MDNMFLINGTRKGIRNDLRKYIRKRHSQKTFAPRPSQSRASEIRSALRNAL